MFDANAATAILPAIAALVAAASTAALLHWRSRLPLATRNARSLHTVPIPRVGGLAIWVPTFLVTAVLVDWWEHQSILLPLAMIGGYAKAPPPRINA